ncbi:MAG TPA: LysR family transcriptional regulator [Hellea balneolensis]|uniref:LysR family transcriptional regulator n=1 Tax=Hellea balneolensis TaxID=287478 RepID=A0A7C5QZ91_9PROT|nr:LysR family transcriptional regulator [Hellea balneolensis]
MPRSLPPLNSVRAFEAVARLQSFSRAAEELGVTQGAISKQVLLLEDYIGMRLFERLPGGPVLTGRGVALHEGVGPAFATLSNVFTRFSRRPTRSNICRISTLSSFASQFLVPRLSKFERLFPDIELEILTSDRVVDLSREEVDFSVRFGNGEWDGVVSKPLCPGRMIPVCTPSYAKRISANSTEEFVNKSRRAQVFSNNEWALWAEAANINILPEAKVFIIEDFLVAMKATLEDQVIALLPDIVVRQYIENGRMIRFCDIDITVKRTYYVAHLPNADQRPIVRTVMDWLYQEITAPVEKTSS